MPNNILQKLQNKMKEIEVEIIYLNCVDIDILQKKAQFDKLKLALENILLEIKYLELLYNK